VVKLGLKWAIVIRRLSIFSALQKEFNSEIKSWDYKNA
jgi:hypothetical protein